MSSNKEVLHVGILLLSPVQFLDIGPVDILGMMTPEYLRVCKLPEPLVAKGQPFVFHYISESGKGSHCMTTAGAQILITDSFESAGKLDILIIPGPEPSYIAPPAVISFIKAKYAEVAHLISICTGAIPLVQTGLLDGKIATCPRGLLPVLQQAHPGVQWQDRRWATADGGKLWMSGGVTNGLDMISAFVKTQYAPEVAALVCEVAEVGDRGQEYQKPAPAFP